MMADSWAVSPRRQNNMQAYKIPKYGHDKDENVIVPD